MAKTVQNITELIRALLNDVPGAVWTDDVLLPFVNSVYRIFKRRLRERGAPTSTADAALAVGAGVTELDADSTPALPGDFISPIKLWEKAAGGKFVEMGRVRYGLPDVAQQATLGLWEWVDNKIKFIGSTDALTVKIRYEKELTDLALIAPDNEVELHDAIDAMAHGAAAMAARSRGAQALAKDLLAVLDEETRTAINRENLGEHAKTQPAGGTGAPQ